MYWIYEAKKIIEYSILTCLASIQERSLHNIGSGRQLLINHILNPPEKLEHVPAQTHFLSRKPTLSLKKKCWGFVLCYCKKKNVPVASCNVITMNNVLWFCHHILWAHLVWLKKKYFFFMFVKNVNSHLEKNNKSH